MKEEKKTLAKEIKKTEITNLSDAEFKTGDQDAQRTH